MSKSCQGTDLTTKIIKENADTFKDFIHAKINASIKKNELPSILQLKKPQKKTLKSSKHNYRSISILQNIPKV